MQSSGNPGAFRLVTRHVWLSLLLFTITNTIMSSQPLLPGSDRTLPQKRKGILTTVLVPLLLIAGVIYVAVRGERIPTDPLELANYYLAQ